MGRTSLRWQSPSALVTPPGPAAPPALVQSPGFTSGVSTSALSTLAAGATAGSLIVAVVNAGAVLTAPSGFTSAVDGLNFTDLQIFYKVAAGGETGITSTLASSQKWVAWAAEYSGGWIAPLDKTATANTSTTTSTIPCGTTAALAGAGELGICAVGADSADVVTGVTSPFALVSYLAANSATLGIGVIIGTADGSPLAPSFTLGTPDSNLVGSVAAFKVG